jgi:hypothetical protein
MIAGFFAIAQIMLKQASRDRENDRKERKEFSNAIKDMANSNRLIAQETKVVAQETRNGNKEAKIRNGHLGEQNIQIVELVKSTKKDMLAAMQNVKVQHVGHQTVDEEVVLNKESYATSNN